MDIVHLPCKFTPATAKTLVKDEEGDPPNSTYNYASVISMLQYLQVDSRPYIIYAVSVCACFVHLQMFSHEITLEHIVQYLNGTLEEYLILRPSEHLYIDVYFVTNFSKLWQYDYKQEPYRFCHLHFILFGQLYYKTSDVNSPVHYGKIV